MTHRVAFLLAVLVCATSAACGGDDSGIGADGGISRDATVVEAGPDPDGGVARDATPDGAAADAGPPACPEPPEIDCDPVEGADCSGEEACVLESAAPTCALTTGTGARGDACTTTADCAVGFACFARRGTGTCGRICCGDRTTCTDGERCGGPGVLADGTETPYSWCVPPRPCDVFEPAAECEPGEACYIVAADGSTDCRVSGTGETGYPCASQSDCAPGFFCGGLSASACVRICEIGASGGVRACPSAEGMCRAYPHTPTGTGLCTMETASAR